MNYEEAIDKQIKVLEEMQSEEYIVETKCEIASTISLLAARGNNMKKNK